MIRHEGGSVDQVMRAVDELEKMVAGARVSFGNQCMLRRDLLVDVISDISDALPTAVTQGSAVLA